MKLLEDGRYHHTFRQSWLKTADLCAERGRLDMYDHIDRTSDSAAIGTAVHSGIESWFENTNLGLSDITGTSLAKFRALAKDPDFYWTTHDMKSATKLAETCTEMWWRQVMPTLDPCARSEVEFRFPIIEDDTRLIELSGTMDYYSERYGDLIDWKTGSRKYSQAEHERWAIQPTVYTLAAVKTLGLDPKAFKDQQVPFEFVIMLGKGKSPTVQRLGVTRGPDHWAWLERRCLAWAKLDEAALEEWPMSDDHFLCSSKWCPHWATCKGAAVKDTWS